MIRGWGELLALRPGRLIVLLAAAVTVLVARAAWTDSAPTFAGRNDLAGGPDRMRYTDPDRVRRLPAEFSPQAGVVVATRDWFPDSTDLLLEIVTATRTEVLTYILSGSREDDEAMRDLIARHSGPESLSRVRFLRAEHDSGWIRDYGPSMVTLGAGGRVFLDWWYDDAARIRDDRVPSLLSDVFGVTREEVRLRLEGGNLLSDGHGLCLTTRRLIDDNAELGLDESAIRDLLEDHCGCERTEFLEPLVGEGTGHVDMFATIVAKGTVVVGSFDSGEDRANAALLDRNARRLRSVARVHRVPMPSHRDGVWRTYTNVLFVNRKVLVPIYPEAGDPALEKRALEVFSRILPGRRVVPIDVESVVESGGAIHCLTLNLPVGSAPRLRPPLPYRSVQSSRSSAWPLPASP